MKGKQKSTVSAILKRLLLVKYPSFRIYADKTSFFHSIVIQYVFSVVITPVKYDFICALSMELLISFHKL